MFFSPPQKSWFAIHVGLAQCHALEGNERAGAELVAKLDSLVFQIPALSPLRIPYARLLCDYGRCAEVFDDVCSAMEDCGPPEYVALLPAFKKFKVLLDMSKKTKPLLEKVAGVVIRYSADVGSYAGGAEALVNMNFLALAKKLEHDLCM